jgi:predicted ATPase/class 3 adenylate cyclase/DNA-binding XRE family transcriptional regulator
VDGYSFGEWLRQRRSALLLSREDLAHQVGCAVVTLRKIEADERRPSLAVAERLAERLELGREERTLFIQVARGLATADRLPPPIPRGPAPALLVSPTPPPATPILPSGTVTFLFTDIAGSTQLWEQHPQAMPAALARHDAILRDAITARGGLVFKTVGDAICAAFGAAPNALAAALGAQRALAAEPWEPTGPIQVRMALHTGVAEERAGDYFGPVLNRVARLRDVGHGGQVLLSSATWELLRDHLPPDVVLRDLGAQRLKDLSRSEQIFQLVTPDLPSTFPPLITRDRPATNLPAQATTFIGREQQVKALHTLVRRPDVRLITLTGPGGTGKTRLAIEAAAQLLALSPSSSPAPSIDGQSDATATQERGAEAPPLLSQRERGLGGESLLPDGVWFVDLAPISDPSLVASTIAHAFGLRELGGQPIQEMLKQYLRAKGMLLLLDNFEQLIAAAPLIAELLAAAPRLKILATSRAALRLSGEHEFTVPPLEAPLRMPTAERAEITDKNTPMVSTARSAVELTQYEAVRLFVERVQAVRADFVLTLENAPVIAEICRRLDGLPLAIELAAARVKLFPPHVLLARLDDRFALLSGGARDLPARQQTLRTTIDWSYNLLSRAEQRLFWRLAVFVGGWTLEVAEAVCDIGGDLGLSMLDGMQALIDNSLVRQEEGLDGAPRFRRLETIREYAVERLEASGEAVALRRRHAEHFLRLAQTADTQLQRAGQGAWLDRLEAEHDNLRAALAWALGGRDIELGCRLVVALAGIVQYAPGFWMARGYWSEGYQWLDLAVSKSSGVAPTLRAMLLTRFVSIVPPMFPVEQAMVLLEEALVLFRVQGDVPGIALTLLQWGTLLLYNRADYPQAAQLLEESLARYQELGDRRSSAAALHFLGDCAREQGDLARAAALLEESIANFRALGANETGLADSLNGLGDVVLRQGNIARATRLYWEAVRLLQEVGDRWSILWPMRNLSWLALIQGDDGRVRALLEEHVAWCRDKQSVDPAFVLHLVGALTNAQGDATRATALLRKALALQQQFNPHLIGESLDGYAWLAVGQGQPAGAARLLGATESMLAGGVPSWRFAHQQLVAAVRAQLDEAAFAAAWAEGQAMTLEQAIAYALSEDEESANPPETSRTNKAT